MMYIPSKYCYRGACGRALCNTHEAWEAGSGMWQFHVLLQMRVILELLLVPPQLSDGANHAGSASHLSLHGTLEIAASVDIDPLWCQRVCVVHDAPHLSRGAAADSILFHESALPVAFSISLWAMSQTKAFSSINKGLLTIITILISGLAFSGFHCQPQRSGQKDIEGVHHNILTWGTHGGAEVWQRSRLIRRAVACKVEYSAYAGAGCIYTEMCTRLGTSSTWTCRKLRGSTTLKGMTRSAGPAGTAILGSLAVFAREKVE